MKFSKFVSVALIATAMMATVVDATARGGMSSGGRGGFSSGGSSMGRSSISTSPRISAPTPQAAPRPMAPAPSQNVAPAAPQRYAQPQTVQRPSQNVAQSAPRTTTTTTTTQTHSSRVNSGAGVSYGGFGMGYPYMATNGLLTGMIIGSMMHPHSTVIYSGPGTYANNALLYPDGRVVSQSGYQVGTYVNGQFTPIQNGGMVAQQVPRDAYAAPQPVVIQKTGPTASDIFFGFLSVLFGMIAFFMLFNLFTSRRF